MIAVDGGMVKMLFAVAVGVVSVNTVACGSGGGGGSTSAPQDIPAPTSSTAMAAIAALWSSLDRTKKLDRFKCHFLIKRGEAIAAAHPAWQAEAGQPNIVTRLKAEMAEIDAFVTSKLGTPVAPGSLTTGTGDPTPHHIDLLDAAKYKTALTADQLNTRFAEFRASRLDRGSVIVWRAVTLETAVWKAEDLTAPASTPTALDTDKLGRLLDRRLHAIERMECNVNSGAPLDRAWTVSSLAGPWSDGYRMRIFEYGLLPSGPFMSIATDMITKGGWAFSSATQLRHDDPYVPSAVAPYFSVDKSALPNLWLFFQQKGSNTPAAVFNTLVTPSTDFLGRSWLYCDHVATALQVESLVFALHRRDNNDDTFNTLAAKSQYLYLGPIAYHRATPLDVLMDNDPADIYFDHVDAALSDLQIGDHLVVWNNAIYDFIATGAWHNEFSFVMDMEGDPLQGVAPDTKLYVAGHGLETSSVADMLKELTDNLVSGIDKAYDAIDAAASGATSVSYAAGQIVRWDPYGETDTWWIQVPPSIWQKWNLTDVNAAQQAMPHSVIAESSPPAGYTPPPGPANSVYFPLWVPKISTSFGEDPWAKYLASRASGTRGGTSLEKITIDGSFAPGLRRVGTTIPVIKPQVF